MRPRLLTEEQFAAHQARVRGGVVGTRYGNKVSPQYPQIPRSRKREASLTVAGAGSNPAPSPSLSYRLLLIGQIVSGKNRVRIRRDGHHYPENRFLNWRSQAFCQILDQGQWGKPTITVPVMLTCDYWPGDHRTRDVSGMLDALFHLLVYAKILKDDGLIYSVSWRRHAVTKIPSVTLAVEAWHV